ncbi:hypothetical protein Tco_1167357 [Tanacetum coccineum]
MEPNTNAAPPRCHVPSTETKTTFVEVLMPQIRTETNAAPLRWCGGGDVGGGGVIATAVSRGDGGDGGSRKIPPEKFSGGGDVVVARMLAREDDRRWRQLGGGRRWSPENFSGDGSRWPAVGKEDMEFESTNSGTNAKLPILKLVPQTTQENSTSVTKMSIPVTVKEKTNKKNDVKARGLLLMALPNEHQLTFSQYPDAKSMFVAIETRFGGNAATKKTQKTLLKQQYKNFSATIVWMNNPEAETMSIDDLYNNFKIVEQKVKKSVGTSSGAQNLAFMTAPSTSSTNDANIASPQVSAASPNVNAASSQVCTASVSDNTVYAFMVKNPNGSNVLHQDLEQIHEDDLEGMYLKWQLSLLSVRAKKYYQRTCKNIFINANDTAGYDKSKVECFDWSDMEEEQVQTNMALMAFSNSKEYTDKTCSKTLATYKRGLATVEAQLITYRKNEVLFSEEVAVLKREVACKDYETNVLKSEFEKVKQEKDGIDFKIEKFDKASKDLDQLLGSQITDKSKKGLGYSAVPPSHPLIYNRPKKLDLSYSGLDEFKEPEFKGYGPEM